MAIYRCPQGGGTNVLRMSRCDETQLREKEPKYQELHQMSELLSEGQMDVIQFWGKEIGLLGVWAVELPTLPNPNNF